jgi:hypothetical protein
MSGGIVETMRKPSYKSVDNYIDYLKRNSPNPQLGRELMDPDIRCTCCTQEAPHAAAALLRVEDKTEYSVQLAGKPGKQVWLCADCYTTGVRPKYLYYGDIRWNRQGRRIKQRTERLRGHPW